MSEVHMWGVWMLIASSIVAAIPFFHGAPTYIVVLAFIVGGPTMFIGCIGFVEFMFWLKSL